ncbi:MAG: class I SAM-dependent methyltransferase [Acidobacteria bacterium]|nr:MAG: class I SAM-dependent methyltransferase [Acidobacteriota bacterium]
MAERLHQARDKSLDTVVTIVHELLRDYHPRDFAIEFWDGSRWEPEQGNFCRFTWHVRTPAALRALLRSDRQVACGEAYIYDDFDFSGDILAIFPVAEYLLEKHLSATEKLRLGSLLLGLPQNPHEAEPLSKLHGLRHTKTRDQCAVSFHYDVSNDFYKLWLDSAMVYSCAYFNSTDDNLDRAQTQKLGYICRKLRLKPGERLLDIGCGWGGLIMHAARNNGVHATGITLSEQQHALAQERIAEAGLKSVCEVRLLDYRDAGKLGEFDKLVSVGMVEHVGENKLPEYFRTAFQLLKPGGVFLNHGIGRAGNRAEPSERTFTDAYVFPDAELIPISTTLRHAEESGFEVRDVENLREHYFLTLCHWLRRLEASADTANEMVGEIKYRIWRLYLAGSAHYFQSGKLALYQSLLTKNIVGRSTVPLTRDDWYH